MQFAIRLVQAGQKLVENVSADYGSVQKNRQKYHNEKITMARLPIDWVRKVGFQTASMIRLMQFGRDAKVPGMAQVVSRMLRHVYGVEVHWDAKIAPGLSIVHGTGLVISHAATVGPGCILFHNVTLGEGLDPVTKERGAPTLASNVHVGPGATLLGPITVGAGSKVAAGVVLTQSVPPNSVVTAAGAQIKSRAKVSHSAVGAAATPRQEHGPADADGTHNEEHL